MLTIVVPYRNRAAHLRIFLRAMDRFLGARGLAHRIVVVHQADDLPFNRGALLNAGFYLSDANADWVCFHDVDMIPQDDSCDYLFRESPTHLAGAVEQFRFRLPYPTYCGGVLALRRSDFRRVNGFSNGYWGWGREDDELYLRLVLHRLELTRKPGRYRSLMHERDPLPSQVAVNTNRLFASLRYVAEAIADRRQRELIEPVAQLCERHHAAVETPVDPASDGLSTLQYEEISRTPLVLDGGAGASGHEMISVKIRPGGGRTESASPVEQEPTDLRGSTHVPVLVPDRL